MEALRVNVGHPKTRKTQTAAYQLQKLEASQKLKERLQQERKREREQKGKTVVSNTKRAKVTKLADGGPSSVLFGVKRWLAQAVAEDAAQ